MTDQAKNWFLENTNEIYNNLRLLAQMKIRKGTNKQYLE
jgi:hypothetical protein